MEDTPKHYHNIVSTCEIMGEDINERFDDIGTLTLVAQRDEETGENQYYFQTAGNIEILEEGLARTLADNPQLVLLVSNAVHSGGASTILSNFERFMMESLLELDNEEDDDDFDDTDGLY